MRFEKTEVWGFEHAIRGMRNPMNSHKKSDSTELAIGSNDLELMQKLIQSGPEHRKFMRQIFVSVDITAPLYWWKEFDTYKIGTTANSTSTMHKLASTPITIDCFEIDDFESINVNKLESTADIWEIIISYCEQLRLKYNETKDKCYWKELIRLLPESWLQTRTVTMNYENVLSMVNQRKKHKLTEWSISLINWVHTLPYANELIFGGYYEKEDEKINN